MLLVQTGADTGDIAKLYPSKSSTVLTSGFTMGMISIQVKPRISSRCYYLYFFSSLSVNTFYNCMEWFTINKICTTHAVKLIIYTGWLLSGHSRILLLQGRHNYRQDHRWPQRSATAHPILDQSYPGLSDPGCWVLPHCPQEAVVVELRNSRTCICIFFAEYRKHCYKWSLRLHDEDIIAP